MQYDYATLTFVQIRVLAHDLGISRQQVAEYGKLSARQSFIDAIEAKLQANLEHEECGEMVEELRLNPDLKGGDFHSIARTNSDEIAHAADSLDVGVIDYANTIQPLAAQEPQPATVIDYGSNPEHLDVDATIDPEKTNIQPAIDKRKALTVFASLLVIAIVAIRAVLLGGCAIARTLILFASMFGRYNPDLDFWYQLQIKASLRRERSLSLATVLAG